MARPISDAELQLKKRARRRLVGAIVLVTAIAVILPMVLDSEPKPVNQNVQIQIPPLDSGEFKPKSTPIRNAPDPAVAKAPEMPAQGDAVAPPAMIVDPAPAIPTKGAATPDSSTAKPAPAAKAVKEAPKAAAKPSGGYAVQIEALADADRAKQLEKRVASAGLPTYTQVVNTKSGDVTRVRAGPYETREAADKAREQLKTIGLDGKVVPR